MEALMTNKKTKSDYIGTGDNLGLPDKLAYLANYGDMFIAVVSKHKTETLSLAEYLESSLSTPVCTLDNYKMAQGQIVDVVAKGFGLETRHSLKAIGEFSKNLVNLGQKPVILITDAHKLKDKVLRTLFSLAERCHLGLVLFGSPSMVKKRGFKDFQNNIHICEIAKMDQHDLQSYIRRKHEGEVLVSSDQLDEILRQSEGSAQKVDRLMEDLLSAPKRRLGVSMMNMSVIVVMLLLGIVYFGQSGFDLSVDEVINPLAITKVFESTSENIDQDFEGKNITDAVKNTTSQKTPFMKTPNNNTAIKSGAMEKKPAEMNQAPTGSEVARQEPLMLAAAVEGTSVALTAVSERISTNNTAQLERAQTSPVITSPAINENLPQSWLTTASPNDYTLQIMGSSSEARIQEYINAQSDRRVFTYYETKRGDQSWFVLTVGQYRDRDAALAAISNLPPNIQSQLPWARNVASIREVLIP